MMQVTQTSEQLVRNYRKASAVVRRKYNTPAKARLFLMKAGILERHAASKNGVRLAKPYR